MAAGASKHSLTLQSVSPTCHIQLIAHQEESPVVMLTNTSPLQYSTVEFQPQTLGGSNLFIFGIRKRKQNWPLFLLFLGRVGERMANKLLFKLPVLSYAIKRKTNAMMLIHTCSYTFIQRRHRSCHRLQAACHAFETLACWALGKASLFISKTYTLYLCQRQ